jgi:hypothetical protein
MDESLLMPGRRRTTGSPSTGGDDHERPSEPPSGSVTRSTECGRLPGNLK